MNPIETFFKILLFTLVLISLYMLVVSISKNNYKYFITFSSWQFPMLLALLIDIMVVEPNYSR